LVFLIVAHWQVSMHDCYVHAKVISCTVECQEMLIPPTLACYSLFGCVHAELKMNGNMNTMTLHFMYPMPGRLFMPFMLSVDL